MLNEQNPDIIHSQGIRADFLNACVRRPAVRITTQRNDPLKDYPMLYGRLAGFTLAYVHYAVLRNLPVVVNCSYSLEISNKSRQLNSSTIQNGIDSDGSYLASDEEKKSIRYQLRLPQDALLFVSAGPLIPRKNPIELISTFREILDKHLGPRPLHLVILGDGPLVYKARETINSIDGIELRGQVNNVGDYMKAADCFLSASLSEGLPNAVIEALSWGTPIIISDIPAHREIHQLDKEIGSLFPLENRELLMRTILGFRPSSSACRAARAIVVNHFNADKMANRYQELYRTAAGAL